MFAPLAKWAARIDGAERIPEYIARAWNVAPRRAARGPSCWRCPRTCSRRRSSVADARPVRAAEAHPAAGDMNRLREMLAGARRPARDPWRRRLVEAKRARTSARFVEANKLPVGCAFRYQDLFDNRLPNYVGDVGIGINPVLRRARAHWRTCCWSSARAWAR